MAGDGESTTAPSNGRGRFLDGDSVTRPPTPSAAYRVFGARTPLAERYARLLAGPAVTRGLLGPHEVDRIWRRHILNCAVLADLIPPSASAVDIGSGAGLPGIVLAIGRPDLEITLLDSALRRVAFLEECVEVLELGPRVRVQRARAADVASNFAADVVTARAVARLDRLAGWAMPMLRPGGQLLAVKGEKAEDELARARPILESLMVRDAAVVRVGQGIVDPPTTVVRVIAGSGPRARRGRRRR